jgi:hypothetical protein
MMPKIGASVAPSVLTKPPMPNSLMKLVQRPPMMSAKTEVISPA